MAIKPQNDTDLLFDSWGELTGSNGCEVEHILKAKAGIEITGNIAVTGTVDGVDIRADRDLTVTGTAGGTANALTLTPSVALLSYVTHTKLRVLIASSNTSAATINVSSLGVKNIRCPDGSALIGGELAAGRFVEMIYNGTNFILTKFEPEWTDYTPTLGAQGSAMISASNKLYARFKHYGDYLDIKIAVNGITIITANTNYLTFSIPKAASGEQLFGALTSPGSGTNIGSIDIPSGSTTAQVYPDPGWTSGGWTTGSSRLFYAHPIRVRC